MDYGIIYFIGLPILLINILFVFLARINRVLWWSTFSLIIIVILNSSGILADFLPLTPLLKDLVTAITFASAVVLPLFWHLSIIRINTPLRISVKGKISRLYLLVFSSAALILLGLFLFSTPLRFSEFYNHYINYFQILYGVLAILFLGMLLELQKTKLEIQSSSIMVWWMLILSGNIYLLSFVFYIFTPYLKELLYAIFLFNNISVWMLFGGLFFFSQSEGYGVIIDQLHDVIFRINSRWQLMNANTSAMKLFGFAGSDLGKDVRKKIQDKIQLGFENYSSQTKFQEILESRDQNSIFFVDTNVYKNDWEGAFNVISIRDITDEVRAQNELKQKISEFEMLYQLSTIGNTTVSMESLLQQTCETARNLLNAEQIIIEIQRYQIQFLYGQPVLREDAPVLTEIRDRLRTNEKDKTEIIINKNELNNRYFLKSYELKSNLQIIGNICFVHVFQEKPQDKGDYYAYQIIEQLSLAISKILILENLEKQIESRTKELVSLNVKLRGEIAEKEKNAGLLLEQKSSLENLVRELNYVNQLNHLINEITFPTEKALGLSVNIISEALFQNQEGGVVLYHHSDVYQSTNFPSVPQNQDNMRHPEIYRNRKLSDQTELVLEIRFVSREFVEDKEIQKVQRFIDTVFEQLIVFVENKLANKKLEDNLEFLQVMVETIPHPVLYKDRDSNYLGCNQLLASQLFGMDKKEILGKNALDFVEVLGPENAKHYIEKDRELFNNPGIQRYEARVDCKDGVQRDFFVQPPDLPEFKRRGCRYCGDHGGCHLNETDYKRFVQVGHCG